MIRTLRVESFKSLVKLELELGRVNVFIGANGSGKSNLLEAVGILGAAAFGRARFFEHAVAIDCVGRSRGKGSARRPRAQGTSPWASVTSTLCAASVLKRRTSSSSRANAWIVRIAEMDS